jgi:bifunctional DNA-binding transcriptional regulator/antitoxin component of YhaV-PrlF toxin-antitoxin module
MISRATIMTNIRINKRGRLTKPKTYRKMLGVEQGVAVLAEPSEQGTLLKSAGSFPTEIYSNSRVAEFDQAEAGLKTHLKGKKPGRNNRI